MKSTWKHPKLGTFKYDDDRGCWIGKCQLPAFKVFKWESRRKNPSGEFEFLFASDDGTEPSTDAATLATLVITNQEKLAFLIAPVLWDDFKGRGPNSGMWWHGDMAQVAEFGYGDRPAPKDSEDLLLAMRFKRLVIHESVYGHKRPIAEFTFAALFEQEHGIGFLTDGKEIKGIGYAQDASPFKT